ncbi:GrpB family protein, partial [Candidatus Shapirobacteria bacterium]|nr:GrpB family protein [Candidatus Shapirobacteria bacterium]
LFPYNKKFPAIFQKQKEKLIKLLGNQEIHHIGSTAVPGLGGKGIIDIMIALKDWEDEKGIIKKLKTIGFTHIHPKNKGRIFISQPPETKYGGIHIHLVKRDSKEYKNLLFFRDYLRKHKKEAQEYGLQKMRLARYPKF